MTERIALETLTLSEISDLFHKVLEIAKPRAKIAIANEFKKLIDTNIINANWIVTYEDFKGAKLNFYCEKNHEQKSPVINIGMTHRNTKGMNLITMDTSNGGIPVNGVVKNEGYDKWTKIYTGHFCKRFAERIMNLDAPTFQIASEAFMFYDMLGFVRITDTITEGIEEIEFQFKEGQAYGYRDSNSKIIYFKTVYSNDMLKRERLDFKKEWEQPLHELYELFSLKK